MIARSNNTRIIYSRLGTNYLLILKGCFGHVTTKVSGSDQKPKEPTTEKVSCHQAIHRHRILYIRCTQDK